MGELRVVVGVAVMASVMASEGLSGDGGLRGEAGVSKERSRSIFFIR